MSRPSNKTWTLSLTCGLASANNVDWTLESERYYRAKCAWCKNSRTHISWISGGFISVGACCLFHTEACHWQNEFLILSLFELVSRHKAKAPQISQLWALTQESARTNNSKCGKSMVRQSAKLNRSVPLFQIVLLAAFDLLWRHIRAGKMSMVDTRSKQEVKDVLWIPGSLRVFIGCNDLSKRVVSKFVQCSFAYCPISVASVLYHIGITDTILLCGSQLTKPNDIEGQHSKLEIMACVPAWKLVQCYFAYCPFFFGMCSFLFQICT